MRTRRRLTWTGCLTLHQTHQNAWKLHCGFNSLSFFTPNSLGSHQPTFKIVRFRTMECIKTCSPWGQRVWYNYKSRLVVWLACTPMGHDGCAGWPGHGRPGVCNCGCLTWEGHLLWLKERFVYGVAKRMLLVKCYDIKKVKSPCRFTILFQWYPLGGRPTKKIHQWGCTWFPLSNSCAILWYEMLSM